MTTPTIPFPAAAVPILGQPCDILGYSAFVHVQCKCPARIPMVINGLGSSITCPACKQSLAFVSLSHDIRTNQGQVMVAQVFLTEADQAKANG